MTVLKVQKVCNNMISKGFRPREGDHTFLVLFIDGKETTIRTKISHGETEISDSLICKMARQIRLKSNEFRDFAPCKMTEDEYVEKLRNMKII